jgi:hypothetical protein
MPEYNDPVVYKTDSTQAAVRAENHNHTPEAGPAVVGISDATAVYGESNTWCGVVGSSHSTSGGAAIWGEHHADGTGVYGKSKGGHAVLGDSETGYAVRGRSQGTGVLGESKTWMGVYGYTESTTGGHAVMGESKGTGAAICGKGGRVAGFFEGDVEVTGDIRLTRADCAEDFDVAATPTVEPGTVMVLGEDGALCPCHLAYDKRAAGVISGAGDYKPGIVLDKQSESSETRKPVALLGKAYCKVDARYGQIEVGDLLTTSETPGHARKATDPLKAFGAVIGKALRPLRDGQGLIPILIALQ